MKKYELIIEKIECEGCINRIKNILNSIKDIESYELSLQTKKLELNLKNDNIQKIKNEIEQLGFIVTNCQEI